MLSFVCIQGNRIFLNAVGARVVLSMDGDLINLVLQV